MKIRRDRFSLFHNPASGRRPGLLQRYAHLIYFLVVGVGLSLFFFIHIYPVEAAERWLVLASAPVVFSYTVIELVVLSCLLTALPVRGIGWAALRYLLVAAFMVVQVAQFLSLYYSGEMLNPLAFAHAELFSLVLNTLTVGTVLVGVPGVLLGYFFLVRRIGAARDTTGGRLRAALAIFVIAALLSVANNNLQSAKEIRWAFQAGKVSPTLGLIDALRSMGQEISDEPVVVLTGEELALADQLGMQIHPEQKLPVIKDWIYRQPLPFPAVAELKTPNVIVIFAESLSSVLLDPYGSGYPELTPNLARFAQHGMTVEGYYGHVAPTVVGLRGQLCSSFPYLTHKDWMRLKFAPPAKPNNCLPKLFTALGYESIYFGADHPGKSFLGYQMEEIGFETLLFYDELLEQYLPGETMDRGRKGNSDRQMFDALTNFLVRRQSADRPFFLGFSTVETHFGVDGLASTAPYGDGREPVLNQFHSFDQAFGRFWDAFLASPAARDTVVILTADHAHGPGADFWPVVKVTDYHKSFFERIPLMIYDPFHELPRRISLNGSSLSLAPTIWQLIGADNNRRNHFLGRSLFDGGDQAAYGIIFGTEVGLVREGGELRGRRTLSHCPNGTAEEDELCALYRVLRYLQQVERNALLWTDTLIAHH